MTRIRPLSGNQRRSQFHISRSLTHSLSPWLYVRITFRLVLRLHNYRVTKLSCGGGHVLALTCTFTPAWNLTPHRFRTLSEHGRGDV
jgi:hypothetical protein